MNFKRCIILIADGARFDVFRDLLEQGRLPNVKRLFSLYPMTYRDAVSSFPTTTGPAYTPFLTGSTPATCNVPGIRWLDRERFGRKGFSLFKIRSYVGFEAYLMDYDLSKKVRTLFEIFKKPFCIFSSLSRGIGIEKLKIFLTRIPLNIESRFFTKDQTRIESYGRKKFFKALRSGSEVMFYAAHAIDDYTHRTHPTSPRTMEAYNSFDELVGITLDELKKLNYLNDTLIVITSDHGGSKIENHCDLTGILENFGLNTLYYPKILKRWSKVNAACMVSGNSMAHIYLKNSDGWRRRCYMEDIRRIYPGLIEKLAKTDEIEHIIMKSENNDVIILTDTGRGIISTKNGGVKYTFERDDPLGIGQPTEFKTDQDILERTFDTQFPDAIFNLKNIFDSPRTGDIIVNSKTGSDLRKGYEIPEHSSTHGTLRREHILVPFLINQEIEERKIRTLDIFPSILDYFGRPSSGITEGRSFVKR